MIKSEPKTKPHRKKTVIETLTPAADTVLRAKSMIANTPKSSAGSNRKNTFNIPVLTGKVTKKRKTKTSTVSTSGKNKRGSKGGGKTKSSKWVGKTIWDFTKKQKKSKAKSK